MGRPELSQGQKYIWARIHARISLNLIAFSILFDISFPD
jgi:hypothetical protein